MFDTQKALLREGRDVTHVRFDLRSPSTCRDFRARLANVPLDFTGFVK